MTNDSRNRKAGQTKETIKIEKLLRRVDSLPTLDHRSEDEILGYDERGMPESPGSNRPNEAQILVARRYERRL
jgi:hypothetical protein